MRRYLQTCLAIRRSPLPTEIKREVARALWRLNWLNLDRSKTVDLVGYRVAFRGGRALRYLFDEVFTKGSYLFECEKAAPIIFDCGSNIGLSVLFFKKLYPCARIVAFEPDPQTFEALHVNIMQNNLANVEAHQVALGGCTGTVQFYRDKDPAISSLVMSTNPERHNGPSIAVPARRLSDFITDDIDMLKIDIEGSELDVLQDLAKTGKITHVRRIHLEYHHHIGQEPDRLSVTLRLLEDAGFGYQIRAGGNWREPRGFQVIGLYCFTGAPSFLHHQRHRYPDFPALEAQSSESFPRQPYAVLFATTPRVGNAFQCGMVRPRKEWRCRRAHLRRQQQPIRTKPQGCLRPVGRTRANPFGLHGVLAAPLGVLRPVPGAAPVGPLADHRAVPHRDPGATPDARRAGRRDGLAGVHA